MGGTRRRLSISSIANWYDPARVPEEESIDHLKKVPFHSSVTTDRIHAIITPEDPQGRAEREVHGNH